MHDTTDETLSLCDLPLYGDQIVEEWEEDLPAESQGSSSMSSSEEDYFEFFSQELSPSTTNFPPENIIFCGKLIPYKQPYTSKNVSSIWSSREQESNKHQEKLWLEYIWMEVWFQKRFQKKNRTIKYKKDHLQPPTNTYHSNKHGKGYDFPVEKMSKFTSSSSGKARGYLFLFGTLRFSSEVELRDIKSRQSRRHCHCLPPSMMSSFQIHEEKVSGGANTDSGMWGLIRVLSCRGNHKPNTMVAGSISCTQRHM